METPTYEEMVEQLKRIETAKTAAPAPKKKERVPGVVHDALLTLPEIETAKANLHARIEKIKADARLTPDAKQADILRLIGDFDADIEKRRERLLPELDKAEAELKGGIEALKRGARIEPRTPEAWAEANARDTFVKLEVAKMSGKELAKAIADAVQAGDIPHAYLLKIHGTERANEINEERFNHKGGTRDGSDFTLAVENLERVTDPDRAKELAELEDGHKQLHTARSGVADFVTQKDFLAVRQRMHLPEPSEGYQLPHTPSAPLSEPTLANRVRI